MATPRGGAVVESERRKIAGQLVYETRFHYERYADESRQYLQSTMGDIPRQTCPAWCDSARPAGRAAIVERQHLWPALRPWQRRWFSPEFRFVERDEAAMARIEAGHPVTPEQVDRLAGMVRSVSKATSVDEGELVRLRGAMMRLDRKRDVATLDEVIARIIPQTLDGQILKGMALQNLHYNKQADEIFSALIAHLDELYNDATRHDVLLAAARNAANLGEEAWRSIAIPGLRSLGTLGDDVRDEYAGVLAKAGFADKAIGVVQAGPATPRSLHLLASIYSSQKKFDKAIEVYRKLLTASPQDAEAERGLADNCALVARL